MSVIFTSTVNTRDTITLPNPKFGDTHTINFKRVNRETRGNDLIISGEPNWHLTELIKFDWDFLWQDQLNAIKAFVRRNNAMPVTLVDHYGQTFHVVFLKPDAEFSQPGRFNWAMTLDMQIVDIE